MKTALVIGLGSMISLLLIAGIFFGMYTANPAAFGVVPQDQAAADSLQNLKKDSLLTASLHADGAIKDSAAEHHAADPIPAPKIETTPPAKKAEPVKSIVFEDTTDWKSKAKLFEAMSIESASSILQTMNDKEVKSIMPHIKKRNAAKILATFDPDRAARIIR